MRETDHAPRSANGHDSKLSRESFPSIRQTPPSGSTSGSTGGGSGSMGFIMGTINSAIALVRNPTGYMTSSKDAPGSVRGIMVNYVAVLAAIPFVATLIGYLWYYDAFLPVGFVGSFIAFAFLSAILTYILDIVGVYVVGMVISMLATSFGSSNDQIKGLRLASFIFTPVFLIGILDIIPILSLLTILGVLYGLYILYLGLPVVLGTPKEKVVGYAIAVVVATFIVYLIIGAVIGVVTAAAFHTGMGII